ncbi:hypothetical protein [Clavibacter tessellarius]|uniref:hypothetical protein n=1 Tax=Clavibacter tessellarius TaxID=31965 RepID=UPI00324791CB
MTDLREPRAAPGLAPPRHVRRARRELRAAAVLLLAQGVLMEGVVAVGLVVLLALGVPQEAITDHADVFALAYLRENLYPMMAMSGVFAALRITAAVGLWRDRLWGLALAGTMCVVTLVLMVFLLPAGILDGVLSGTALALLLHARLGRAADGSPRPALPAAAPR